MFKVAAMVCRFWKEKLDKARNKTGKSPWEISMEFIQLRKLYKHYKYSDLTKHVAAVAIPYQVSLMSLMEIYWMGIPLLLPSPEFYAKLHVEHSVANDLTWKHVGTKLPATSSDVIMKHSSVIQEIPDPMAENNITAMRYWMQFVDWSYQWKNTILFDSWEDLVDKVSNTNFTDVSIRMLEENEIRLSENIRLLGWVMNRVASTATSGRTLPVTMDMSMRRLFGDSISPGNTWVDASSCSPITCDVVGNPVIYSFQIFLGFFSHQKI